MRVRSQLAVLVCLCVAPRDAVGQDLARVTEALATATAAAGGVTSETATAKEAGELSKLAKEAGTKTAEVLAKAQTLSTALGAGDALGDAVKKAVAEVVTAATPANAAIKAAADAAPPLVAKVPSGEAQKGAALASVKAGDAARSAEKALAALTKAKGDYDKALTDGAAADTQIARAANAAARAPADKAKATAVTAGATAATEVVKQATALGGAAREAADGATETSRQAVAPDLPVLTDDDQVIFAALRARITGGAIFFNGKPSVTVTGEGDSATATVSSDQFSQSAMYLAFESQPSLISFHPSMDHGYSRWYVEPFVDVRLTTIPVTGAVPTTRIEAPTAAILQSQKAIQVQGGGILSWNFGGFDVAGSRFHWGIAPMVRVGFQSVSDSSRALRVWNFDDDLFHDVTGGMRLILYKGSRQSGFVPAKGWAPTAYLEVSFGQFQNFETAEALPAKSSAPEDVAAAAAAKACLDNPAHCLAKGLPKSELYEVTSQSNRVYVEARLALNYLYLGLDINNGDGRDDLRVIGGVTVGLDRFFRRSEK